jgi:hypothetical protein
MLLKFCIALKKFLFEVISGVQPLTLEVVLLLYQTPCDLSRLLISIREETYDEHRKTERKPALSKQSRVPLFIPTKNGDFSAIGC